MTSLVQLESFADKCTEVLMLRLDEFAKYHTSIDVSHWMQCYAFDVIGMVTVRHQIHLAWLDNPLMCNRSASASGSLIRVKTFKESCRLSRIICCTAPGSAYFLNGTRLFTVS